MKKVLITLITLSFISNISTAAAAKSIQVPTITVKKDEETGDYFIPNNFAGSASYISQEDIEERQTGDINRVIREIPGVNIQEEDGYGLRPNIGMRGSRSDRSANIVLMEDGILAAPAPYAAPSAYYFPSMGRVKGVEVRKGSSSIKYGPRTTSGALNLITTPIPDFSKGDFTTSVGNFDEKKFNFNYGDTFKNFGYVVNFDQQSSDGFKDLDGGGDTGFNIQDFMTKFRFNTDKTADVYQAVEFKVGINDETSHETYTGLTLSDFNNDPYRRYKASSLDEMNAEHRQYELKHYIEPSKSFNLTTTAYYHEFDRNWYKLNNVDDGSATYESLSTIFGDSSAYSSYLDVIKGNTDGNLKIRANKRSYQTYGIQSIANSDITIWGNDHDFEYGVRYHEDDEDRMQHDDIYSVASGVISLTTEGEAGTAGNKVVSARALSFFLEDEIGFGKLTVIPGIRFEHIELKKEDYKSMVFAQNNEDVLVPGIAVSYAFNDNFSTFAGVHKGFAPPAPGNTADAEESVNYEVGTRYQGKSSSFFESVFFFNDYSNLLGTDTNSSGGSGTGDQDNGGKVIAYGLELATGYKAKAVVLENSVSFPIRASYTFNDSEFRSSFSSSNLAEEWGNVTKGDKLPYIAQHQFSLSMGMEVSKLALNLSNKFVSEMRGTAGQGEIAKSDKIPSHFVTDFSGFYEFKKDQQVFLAVDNIFDRKYATSLRPSGLRPGKPLTARIGLKIGF